jgi:hypothetical protein
VGDAWTDEGDGGGESDDGPESLAAELDEGFSDPEALGDEGDDASWDDEPGDE